MMFRAALGFFTRLPIGSAPLPPTFRGVIVWLPAVGLVIGCLVALALTLVSLAVPPGVCGVLGCLVWVVLTGGLHLDGVADCGDGLIVEAPPARRLEIMKDSRLGTFGGAALFFTLGLKATALAALVSHFAVEPVSGRFFALALCCGLAGVLSRSLVFVAMRVPSARPGGLGEALHDGVTVRHELIALACALVACLANGWVGFGALVCALAVAWLLLTAARRRLGGVTGDVFGCLIETTEWVVLLACVAGTQG